MDNPFRHIPSVNELVDSPLLAEWSQRASRGLVVEAAREVLEGHREALSRGALSREAAGVSQEDLAQRVAEQLEAWQRAPLPAVINATGIIVHTGLGRAPLAPTVVDALVEAARNYVPVELDMPGGQRGKRNHLVRERLSTLTGAEAATVVNNNAAALMIALATLANDRHVIVSRGELIEIGGSFRLPDVMATSGARLREVGTTNKTRISDYENAIDDSVAALLKVHPSNYQVTGFTEETSIGELVDVGRRHDLPVIHDVGSGALVDFGRYGFAGEPVARASIDAGADVVLFSGDKLLGGPQAGILVGRGDLIERIDQHPLMRALRVDKLTLAALAATLDLHRDADRAAEQVPVLAMIRTPVDHLRRRADRLVDRLQDLSGLGVEVVDTTAYLGGGSLPTQGLPSASLRVAVTDMAESQLAAKLRGGAGRATPVLPRVQGGAVLLDLRTVFAEQDDALVEAIRAVL